MTASTSCSPLSRSRHVRRCIRCLKRRDISRLPETGGDKPARRRFKSCSIGFFHIDISEVSTEQGKLHLFVAIDRTSKCAFAQLHGRATTRIAADFLCTLLQAVPCRVHTVLTDNGQHFTTPGNSASAASLIRDAMDHGGIFRAHSFELACAQIGAEATGITAFVRVTTVAMPEPSMRGVARA